MENYFIPKYKGDVEESTFSTRKNAFNYAINHFGNKLLEDITIMDCEKFRTWLLTKSTLSRNYSSMVYVAFRQTLNYAVSIGILNENVSLKTKAIPKDKSIVDYWEKHQFEKVISTFNLDDYYEHFSFIMVWLYFMTGIRVSEELALQWSDIDFSNKKLRVHHNLYLKSKTDYEIKPYTKTTSGKRLISLDSDTISLLSQWKTAQKAHGVYNFVLSYDDRPVVKSTIGRIIKRHALSANVSPITPKGLRHSHVSYLINEFNADILTISQRLGHSSPDITLKYYSHIWNRNADNLVKQMAGNIHLNFYDHHSTKFNGNQFVSKTN